MTVGGSKGSHPATSPWKRPTVWSPVGSRFVCQSDCSRTGYPKVKQVININADIDSAMHYRQDHPVGR